MAALWWAESASEAERARVILRVFRSAQTVAPLEAGVFVEIAFGIEWDVEFEVAGVAFEPECAGLGAVAGGVGFVSESVGVLEEVEFLLEGRGEEDVVGAGDGVVVGVLGACGCVGWSVFGGDSV